MNRRMFQHMMLMGPFSGAYSLPSLGEPTVERRLDKACSDDLERKFQEAEERGDEERKRKAEEKRRRKGR